MAAVSSRTKWLMDPVWYADVLMRTKAAFHWQRTLSKLKVLGDWLNNGGAALILVQTPSWVESSRQKPCIIEHLKVESAELNMKAVNQSAHPSIANVSSSSHFSAMCMAPHHCSSVCSLCVREDAHRYRHSGSGSFLVIADNHLSVFVAFK